ncbi:MAG TPA: 4-hydroxy-tetrahydrodipicolinate synthase [Candidatus Faecousia gallistercoris]|nr:4-hydroxy-tetrahydrodipicolinate synthase [Candidatus Faecousia gallistercoris]
MKPLFQGACTALVTPFRLDFVHTEAYDQLLDRQMKAGIAALVVCGTTGESATMSDTERLDLIGHTVDYVRGRCKVIAGTGSNHTAHAVTLSKEAEKLGADGLLLVSPYYNKATEAGLIAHYTAIADQVHIPCIAYNVPSRTGVDIPVSVYRALAAHPNFCGVKEAGGDVGKIARIRQACGPEFFIWSGNDDQTVPVMALGGLGVISVLSNLYPETVVRLTGLCLAGRYREAANLQAALMPIIDALFCEVNPIPVKAALRLAGLDVGHCRLPLTDPTPEHLELLRRLVGAPSGTPGSSSGPGPEPEHG